MTGKIFINYRRDDVPGDARGIRDGLVAKFGKSAVFMDVDNLLAGQRFDKELAKALDQCSVLIAVIGPRWMDLLRSRVEGSDRDYVREEIAAALKRDIPVIPARVGREGALSPLPRADQLPDDIGALVLHQKHDVSQERFGRDVADLVREIGLVKRGARAPAPWGKIAGGIVGTVALGAVVFFWPQVSNFFKSNPAATQVAFPATQAPPVTPPDSNSPKIPMAQRAANMVANAKHRALDAASTLAAKLPDVGMQPSNKPATASDNQNSVDLEIQKPSLPTLPATSVPNAEAEAQRLAMLAEQEKKSEPQRKPGETFRDCPDVCPEMVVVPAGEFEMGSSDPHNVKLSKPFAVGKFEVTFAEWGLCVSGGACKTNPWHEGWGRGRRPVIYVSWTQTKEYTAWISKKAGSIYRLLSEAEWEYAARAGQPTKFAFGDEITKQQAQFSEASFGSAVKTVEVGSFKPNSFGLYDMHGNVWEWVEDCWLSDYKYAPANGSALTREGDCSRRVLRGGSWYNFSFNLGSAYRYELPIGTKNAMVGFRVARDLP